MPSRPLLWCRTFSDLRASRATLTPGIGPHRLDPRHFTPHQAAPVPHMEEIRICRDLPQLASASVIRFTNSPGYILWE